MDAGVFFSTVPKQHMLEENGLPQSSVIQNDVLHQSFAEMQERRYPPFLFLAFLSLLSGCITTLALPPYNYVVAGVFGFSGFLYAVSNAQTSLKAACLGWLFGFGFYGLSLSWVAHALSFDPAFKAFIPLTQFGIPAALGVYCALVAFFTHKSGWGGVSRWLLFAVLWAGIEYAKDIIGLPFPWNIVGYTWTNTLPVLQVTSLVGIHSLSALTVLLWTMPLLWKATNGKLFMVITAVLFAVSYGWGNTRLAALPLPPQKAIIRLVQPNLAQKDKMSAEAFKESFSLLLRLSSKPATESITAVVWPETAAPFDIETNAEKRAAITDALPKGATLLTGLVRIAKDDTTGNEDFRNSLITLSPEGNINSVYDKTILVPFGEYIPFRQYLKSLKAVGGVGDFGRGKGAKTINIVGVPPFSPLICYEAVFSGQVVEKNTRPQWLVTISNDAWYGNSAGPYQHAAFAKVRAIEEGVPLVRVANTGISFVADIFGRTQGDTVLNTEAVMDIALPAVLETPTLFSRYGNQLFAVLLFGLGMFAFLWRERR